MDKREVSSFVVIDHDRKMFNVIDPVTSLRWWEQKMLEARDNGRDIRGYASNKPANVVKKEHQEQFGYTYMVNSVLLSMK